MVKSSLVFFFLTMSSFLVATEFGLIFGGGIAQAYGSKEQANDYLIDIKHYPVVRTGILVEHDISSNLTFVQEVLYSQKGSKQTIKVKEQPVKFTLQYDLDYLEVPFLIKYNLIDYKKVKIHSLVGFSFSYLLKAHYDLDGQVEIASGDALSIIPLEDSYEIKDLDEFDYSLLYGFSTDLNTFGLPLCIEYRFSLSWYKINFPTYQDMEPVVLSNQSHVLTLSYKI